MAEPARIPLGVGVGSANNRHIRITAPSVGFERELPRAATGKLYKKELKARFWPAG